MVPGVALVARQVDGAIDIDRQIGVDLNQAAIVALIPVVAAPGLVGDVLDREALVRRQRDVLERTIACRRFSVVIQWLYHPTGSAAKQR